MYAEIKKIDGKLSVIHHPGSGDSYITTDFAWAVLFGARLPEDLREEVKEEIKKSSSDWKTWERSDWEKHPEFFPTPRYYIGVQEYAPGTFLEEGGVSASYRTLEEAKADKKNMYYYGVFSTD